MITPSKEFLDIFKKTEGALSVTESIAIMNIAAQAPEGVYMELGTYKGKSALSAIQSLKADKKREVLQYRDFNLVDPEFKDGKWCDEVTTTLIQCNPAYIKFNLIPLYSLQFIHKLNDLSYVFVDSGSHQDGLPMQEVRLLEDRIVPNGIIAFHDFLSQFIEVEEAYNYLLGTGKYEEIIIDWQPIIDYVNENNLEEDNNSWHHTELKNPCFVGALKRK